MSTSTWLGSITALVATEPSFQVRLLRFFEISPGADGCMQGSRLQPDSPCNFGIFALLSKVAPAAGIIAWKWHIRCTSSDGWAAKLAASVLPVADSPSPARASEKPERRISAPGSNVKSVASGVSRHVTTLVYPEIVGGELDLSSAGSP